MGLSTQKQQMMSAVQINSVAQSDNIKLLGYLQSVGNNFKSWSLKKKVNENQESQENQPLRRGVIHFYVFNKNLGLIRRKKEVLFDYETINQMALDRVNQQKYGMISFEQMMNSNSNSNNNNGNLFLFHGQNLPNSSGKLKISSIIKPKTKFGQMKNRANLKIDSQIEEIWDVLKKSLPKDNQVLVKKIC